MCVLFPRHLAAALFIAGPKTRAADNTDESIDVDSPAGFASTLDNWGP